MAEETSISLTWSSQYTLAPTSRATSSLPGDKILLPPSALEQLLSAATVTTTQQRQSQANYDPFNPYSLAAARQSQSQWRDTQQQLPHPLTFRLVNPANGNVVHAGIREFSADDGEIGLSPFLIEALGLKDAPTKEKKEKDGDRDSPIDLTEEKDEVMEDVPRVVVHAKQLPKGTYVRLRPLEAGYNPDDWKSLLERHLRENYTTLTNGEILTVQGRGQKEEFRFLIDKFKPEGDGICVVDTDLEVDIEALNEEQARETLKQIMKNSQRPQGSAEGSSMGGDLNIWNEVTGQVLPGDYVDYTLPSWDRTSGLDIELHNEDGDVDIFISPFSARQRARPRADEHVLSDIGNEPARKIRLQPTNVLLEDAESLYISVHVPSIPEDEDIQARPFTLRVRILEKEVIDLSASNDNADTAPNPDEEKCKNCQQWIPKRTMMLHENFCLRNNILCPQCKSVFKKNSPEWQAHWHCPHDSSHGSTPASKAKHDMAYHTPQACPGCEYEATNLLDLAQHRTTVCPSKLILCQFCHLSVPQDGPPTPESLLSNLTPHELEDGARTTECHLCAKIVRLRDMATHLKHHDLSKKTRVEPRFCRNGICGRTLDGVGKNGEIGTAAKMGQGPGNDLGLCSICFGPLYVSMHDPEGKAMRRRIERRYLSQVITGCGRSWCRNPYCKTGKKNTATAADGAQGVIGTKEALPLVKPLVDGIPDHRNLMWFCVDEGSQKRRVLADMLESEGIYERGWCIAACEAAGGDLDSARTWLANWAPGKNDT